MPSPSIMDWRTVSKVPSSLSLPDMFLRRVDRGSCVLDVGCGEAGIGAGIGALGGCYVGLDVNLPSLRRASARHHVALGEGGRLPFRDGAFDLVMLRAVLTVLVDPVLRLDAVREALRVCRGAVGVQDFLMTPDIPLYAARYEEGLALSGQRGAFPVRQGGELLYWAKHFTPEELAELFRNAGGRVIESRETPAPTRSGNIIRGITLLAASR